MVVRVSAPSPIGDEPKRSGRPHAVTVVEREIQALRGRNAISIAELEQMDTSVANVGYLQLAVRQDLPLDCQVPLPGVWEIRVGRDTVTWGPGSSQRTGRGGGIKRASPSSTQGEWRVSRQLQIVVQALALEELAQPGANRHFAVVTGIPGDAESWGDGMVVLVFQGAVRARCSAKEPGRLAEICAWNNQDSVAGIPAQGRFVSGGTEAGDLVRSAVGIAQHRPAKAIF